MNASFHAWLPVLVLLLASATLGQAAQPVTVEIAENTVDRIVLQYDLDDFAQSSVLIDGQEYATIALGKESVMKQIVGAPELPNVCRSVAIPADAEMDARVVAADFYDIDDIDIAPSKGFILRTTNPDDVPYTFGDVYSTDADYPGKLVTLREPYILRDQRGVVVELYPFQYNPVRRTLRVYTSITVEVVNVGPGKVNVLQPRFREPSLAFHRLCDRHFLNYSPGLRYTPLDETGDMLIICHDAWVTNVQPLVDHKIARGIDTTVVPVSDIGNNATSIKAYIQDQYDTTDLAFVLLVGDGPQLASPFASGGSADPTYALVAGTDNYPDILVGRFSAQKASHVDTQVLRTIEYEQMPALAQPWFKRGLGVASDQGPGDDDENDDEHMNVIRADLLNNGYTQVDGIYDPYGTAAQVSTAINAGRGIINYCGHGSTTAWTSTGFSSTHVNALVNDNELPFVISVACVNGRFEGTTCFAEAWLLSTNGPEPTGAIAAYMSSINQSWSPPMAAQDECVDLLVAGEYSSFGALCFAGSCKMIDEYGYAGIETFNTWHLFGDPSVTVSDTVPPEILGDWKSWKDHGDAGRLFIPISPTGNPGVSPFRGVETRADGITELECAFTEPINMPDVTDITMCGCVSGPYHPDSVSLDPTGTVLTMYWSGIPNGQASGGPDIYKVTIDNVTDLAGNPLTGDNDINVWTQFGNVKIKPAYPYRSNTDDFDLTDLSINYTAAVTQGACMYDIYLASGSKGKVDDFDLTALSTYYSTMPCTAPPETCP